MPRDKALKTSAVAVSTASVDIQLMRVGTKQLTLAVFRQLEQDNKIDGPIWGWVNYHPDKCDYSGHRHVIWQKGDELRRATIFNHSSRKFKVEIEDGPGAGWVCAAMLEGWRPEVWPNYSESKLTYDFPNTDRSVYFARKLWGPAQNFVAVLDQQHAEKVDLNQILDTEGNVVNLRYKYLEHTLKECRELAGKKSASAWEIEIRRLIELAQADEQKLKRVWEVALGLQQLFIAV